MIGKRQLGLSQQCGPGTRCWVINHSKTYRFIAAHDFIGRVQLGSSVPGSFHLRVGHSVVFSWWMGWPRGSKITSIASLPVGEDGWKAGFC